MKSIRGLGLFFDFHQPLCTIAFIDIQILMFPVTLGD